MTTNLLNAILENISADTIKANVKNLIAFLDAELHEPALTFLTGCAQTTVTSKEFVEVTIQVPAECKATNPVVYEVQPDLLRQRVLIRCQFEYTFPRFYKTQEDADLNQNGYCYSTDDRPIKKIVTKTEKTSKHIPLHKWNSGAITINY